MADSNPRRRGWCPGVWTPMESGDGWIVRVRLARGRLTAAQLRGLAMAARTSGNGIVELTRRASLQLRGASATSLPDLQAELCRLGLTESSDAEKRPSLLMCPMSGLDPRSPALEPLTEQLAPWLSSAEAARGLSEKFLVVVSGGSDLCEHLRPDIHVALQRARPGVADLSLPGLAERDTLLLGAHRVTDVPRAVAVLVSTLQATCGAGLRMRDGIRVRGSAVFRAAVEGLRLDEAGREPAWPASCLGFHSGLQSWLGFELPFGSAEAEVFAAIADLAERSGTGEVRLTPTRSVLLPGVSVAARQPVEAFARAHHLSLERRVPGLQVVACSGAPACRSAHGETRRLALGLAELVRIGAHATGTLHVSGCEKSCAWGGAADITLVHAADGSRLGFGTDVAQTSATPVLSLDAVRERLSLAYGGHAPSS